MARTRELPGSPDLAALTARARDRGWDGALIERTLPDAVSLAALGRTLELVGDGASTWAEDERGRRLGPGSGVPAAAGAGVAGLGAAWRGVADAAWALDDPGVPATGVVAVGGFAFRDGRPPPEGVWAGFPTTLLRVPALAVVRSAGRCFTVATTLAQTGEPLGVVSRRLARAERLLHLGAVAPTEAPPGARPPRIRAVPKPGAQAAWAADVGRIHGALGTDGLDKVVLVRALPVRADRPLRLLPVVGALRAAYPGGHTFAIGGADGTCLVGSSPELLVERRGDHLVSRPLAGSTGRAATAGGDRRLAAALRADPKERAEHRIVVEAIASGLDPLARRVTVGGRPAVLRLPTIQHLATTIRARLVGVPLPSLLDAAAAIHPTPAVGGRPPAAALALLDTLEGAAGLERGWYTGAVGWVDRRGDGELAVALRCGLLWADGAVLFAGAGIVAGSDPGREWAETELKLQPMLRALAS